MPPRQIRICDGESHEMRRAFTPACMLPCMERYKYERCTARIRASLRVKENLWKAPTHASQLCSLGEHVRACVCS
eukprot:755370-Pleurochrysis_carterae.AAC.2